MTCFECGCNVEKDNIGGRLGGLVICLECLAENDPGLFEEE